MKRKILLLSILSFVICVGVFAMGKKPVDNYVQEKPYISETDYVPETSYSPKNTSVTGKFAYYGNEPFVYMAIKTDDGKTYKIQGDERVLKSLKAEFGKKIKFYGKLYESEKKPNEFREYDGILELEHFKVYK